MTTDLSTKYLGLKLANPIVVSACPLTGELDVLRKLEDFGAAAAVLPSLFEEQFETKATDAESTPHPTKFLDNLAYFQELKEYNRGPAAYLQHLTAAKKAVAIPIIGSLNVTGPGDVVRYAKQIQEAGADALELNIYVVPTDPNVTSQQIETRYVELVAAARNQISIPLAIKIGPYFTSLPNMARRLVEAGADGLIFFNRFLQPDIDIDHMRVDARLHLSTPDELRLPLRWIALLHGRLPASLAATSGIHFADDIVRLLMAGSDAVMVASALYQHGVEVLQTFVDGLRYWLDSHDYHSVEQIKGCLSQRRCPDPAVFERVNYTRAIASFLNEPV
ncbi:MAG: dihydroorotate dehydrogenase-like protein [Pirellulales bacterium]